MSRIVAVATLSLLLQAAPRAGFRGSWKVTEMMVPQAPDYRVPRVNYPEGMPGVGSVVQFTGKRMCVVSPPEERVCHDVATELKTMADIPGGVDDAALLKVPASTKYILLLLDGRADYGFVAMPDHRLFADFAVCPQPSRCTAAFEVWTPVGKDARVVYSK